VIPLFSLALGFLFLGIQWSNGDPGSGLVSLAIMVAFGAVILFGGRSETIRGLRGDGRDERFRQIDIRATAFAGTILVLTLTTVWLIELGRGRSGSPYTELMAVGGVAYLAAIAFMRWRG